MKFVGNSVPEYPAALNPIDPEDITDKNYVDTRLNWGYASVLTAETRATTTYGDLTTVGPTVTLVTGTLVKVTLQCGSYITVGSSGGLAAMGFAVSGATTIAASDDYANMSNTTAVNKQQQQSAVYIVSVTAGSNTFQAKYAALSSSTTAGFQRRMMIVERMN